MAQSDNRVRLALVAAAIALSALAIVVLLTNSPSGIDDGWFDQCFDASWDSGNPKESK